jgi:hypothetical protein
MRCKAKTVILAIAIGLALPVIGFSQNITSMIVGDVRDSTGAVAPGADVTVTNQGTGISAHTVTDSAGSYSVPNLLAGTYSVTVSKAGFATYKVTGIAVQASSTVRQDAVLKVGATRQEVTVTGSTPLIRTDSTTIGGVVATQQFVNLPESTQSIDTLLTLVPGAQDTGSNPQFGGTTHDGANNFTLNGISINDAGNGGSSYSYGQGLVNDPDLGSLQEIQVLSSVMNAEYRGVASITLVTKQGSNQFHGSTYEYNEQTGFNANTFLLNATSKPRAVLHRNQFGGNVGGPILKNKAFFFFDFGGFRQIATTNPSPSSTNLLNFPTAAERGGNFGALCSSFSATTGICTSGTQLYNPFTGAAFASNVIPTSMITSQATTILSGFVPLPNAPSTSPGLPNEAYNYLGSVSEPTDFDTYTTRVDYTFSPKDTLFAVYSHNTGLPWGSAQGTPSTFGNGSDFGYYDQSIAGTETHTFSPTTINDIRLGWFSHTSVRLGQNSNFVPTTLFPQLTPSLERGIPSFTMTGYQTIDDYGYFPKWGFCVECDYQGTDNFTHVHGRHTFKAGVDISRYRTFASGGAGPMGTFTFNGQWTGNKGYPTSLGYSQSQGNAFADFLLGTANTSANAALRIDNEFFDWDSEMYAQDTFQASSKLTIYFGLRYMYQAPWSPRNWTVSQLDIASNKLVLPENSSTPTLPPGANAGLFAAYSYTTTQALGMPLQIIKPDKDNFNPRLGFAYRPFSSSSTVFRGGYGVYHNFEPFLTGPEDIDGNPPYGGTALSYTTKLSGSITAPFLPDLTFSNPFPATQGGFTAPANPSLWFMEPDFRNAVAQEWNLTAEHQFTSNLMGRISYVGNQTHHIPWFESDINVPVTQTPGETTQQQRPLQPWSTIYSIRSGSKLNLNQLQLEVIKRVSNGLSFQVEYQWTQSLDNDLYAVNPQNWHNPNADYGFSENDRRHVLIFNYIYALPVGHGKHFLGNSHGVEEAFLGGWQASGITTYETGTPFSVAFSVPSSKIGWWGGRADRVPGPLYDKTGGHNIISGVQWFNPAAFAPPQPWAWGNSSEDSVFGPGVANWDMNLQKSLLLKERLTLKLRLDAFDSLNHMNLSNPNATIADTRDGGPAVPSAGLINSGSGNRTLQIGARLEF